MQLRAAMMQTRKPRHNKQLLLPAPGVTVGARTLRARAAFCWDAPQQNCGRYAASPTASPQSLHPPGHTG